MAETKTYNFSQKLLQLEDSLNRIKHSEKSSKLSKEDIQKIDEIIIEIKSISNNSHPDIIAPIFLQILKSISNLLVH